jgi:hypothetical protein
MKFVIRYEKYPKLLRNFRSVMSFDIITSKHQIELKKHVKKNALLSWNIFDRFVTSEIILRHQCDQG